MASVSGTQPVLSIIVPAHNEEAFLGACLRSLKEQSAGGYEVIVVDNNSTDRTGEIARRHFDQVLVEEQKGYHHAVRRGVEASRGELLAVCDADTVYPPDWVEKAQGLFRPEYAGIYGAIDFHDGHWLQRHLIRFFCFTVFMRLMIPLGIDVCNGLNFVFRRDAYLRVGGYDPAIYNRAGLDIDLGRRLKAVGPLRFKPALKSRTSLRRILHGGLGRFLAINLALYWAMLRGRNAGSSYEEYNLK